MIVLSPDAIEVLQQLRREVGGEYASTTTLRLSEHVDVALTVAQPEPEDFIIEHNGIPLVAVSPTVLEQVGENARIEVRYEGPDGPKLTIVGDPPAQGPDR